MKQKTGLIFFSFFIVQLSFFTNVFGQEVEHNYKVGPQFTTCDSLDFESVDSDEAIELIRETKFRFQQSFKLTRRQGFKGGEIYSCNNESGFLVVKLDDHEILYKNVELRFWNELISSSDPEGYYLKNKENLSSF